MVGAVLETAAGLAEDDTAPTEPVVQSDSVRKSLDCEPILDVDAEMLP